jgi:hypothetical protein
MRIRQFLLRERWWQDALLLYAIAIVLVFPLFRIEYLNNWPSIEATFIADARLLTENWPQHLWQPLWYGGTRADYVYPPGLRYGGALLSALLGTSHAHAYHILIALTYAFGIVATYLWTRTVTGRRGAAWLAALGVALLSPSFLVMADLRQDSPFMVPWRLHVLVRYGEGPHVSSLAVLPLVWLCAWRRFHGGRLFWLGLAACSAALVVTFNFYGATALAVTFPLLVWSCFLRGWDWRVVRDSIFIVVLSYGLTAWWLVPSFLRITGRNLRMVSPPGNRWSLPVLILILSLYVLISIRIRRSRTFSEYSYFIWSSLGFFAILILGARWFDFQVAGNSLRLIPEMDALAILCATQIVGLLWSARFKPRARLALRSAIIVLLLISFRPAWRYAKHVYVEFPEDRQWQEGVQFKTARWLREHFPDSRVFVTGSIRFWYNVWFSGEQMDGGSQQGVLNPLFPTAQWRVVHDPDPELALYWLQAFGVDIVVVPGRGSPEPYVDFNHPQLYERHFPLLYDDGAGIRYYRVPRRSAGIVSIVDQARLQGLQPVPLESEKPALSAYAAAIQAVPPGGPSQERLRARWLNSDALDVNADLAAGESVLVGQTYDRYWRAYVDGRPQPIQADAAGFILVHAAPGKHDIHIVFETPLEIAIGRAVTLISFALVLLFAVKAILEQARSRSLRTDRRKAVSTIGQDHS